MTPTEMLGRMTSRELTEQMAYDQLESEDLARSAASAPMEPPSQEELASKLFRVFRVSNG